MGMRNEPARSQSPCYDTSAPGRAQTAARGAMPKLIARPCLRLATPAPPQGGGRAREAHHRTAVDELAKPGVQARAYGRRERLGGSLAAIRLSATRSGDPQTRGGFDPCSGLTSIRCVRPSVRAANIKGANSAGCGRTRPFTVQRGVVPTRPTHFGQTPAASSYVCSWLLVRALVTLAVHVTMAANPAMASRHHAVLCAKSGMLASNTPLLWPRAP